VIYVNEALCTGCGTCAEICPTGAIQIVNDLAHIDHDMCKACDACLAECPQGAMLAIEEPIRVKRAIVKREPAVVSEPALSSRKLVPALGAALIFVGQEVIPRMAWALLDAWDRRQQTRSSIVSSPVVDISEQSERRPRGGRRRRWRGGR